MVNKILKFIFVVCAFLWLYEMGNLIFVDDYQMTWFNQLMSAFTSVMAMITWLFEEMN